MANKIGIVIAADGEAQFSQAMRNCSQGAKNLQSDLRTLKNDFKDNANSMEYLSQRQEMLTKSQDAYQKKLEAAKNGLKNQHETYKNQQKSLDDLKKKYDEAQRAVQKFDKAGDNSSKEYREAKKACEDYSKAISKQELEIQKSDGALTKWEHAVNQAEHDVRQNSKAVEENAKYLNEAKTSADGCATSIDKFGNETKKAGDKAGQSTSKIKSMLSTIKQGALEKVGHLITDGLRELGQQAIEAAKYVVDVGSTFEAAMDKVEALSGATGSELDALKDKASELGRTTQFSASEAADALSNMALAGWSTQEMLNGIDGVLQLAAAGGMDLATAADTVAGYLAAFNMEASESSKLADVMATAQAKSKTTTDQLASAYSTCATNLTQAGQEMTTTTALLEGMASVNDTGSAAGTKLSAVMAQITQKMKDGKIEIGDTKVAVTDSTGAFRDMVDIIEDVENATNGMTDAERANALQKTFNRQSAAGMNELLSVGSEQLRTYKHDLEQSEGAASEMAATLNDNLQGKIKEFNSATEGLGTTLYDKVSGPLTSAVQFATNLINGITDSIAPQQTALDNFLKDIDAGIEKVNSLLDAAEQEEIQAETKIIELEGYKRTIIDLQKIIQSGGKLDPYQIYMMKTAVDAVKDDVPYIGDNFDAVTGRINLTTNTIETLFKTSQDGIRETARANILAMQEEAVAVAEIEKARAQAALDAASKALDEIKEKYSGEESFTFGVPTGADQEIKEYEDAVASAEKRVKSADAALQEANKDLEETRSGLDKLSESAKKSEDAATSTEALRKEQLAAREVTEKATAATKEGTKANEDYAESEEEVAESAEEASKKQEEYAKAVEEAHKNASEQIESTYNSVKQAIENSFDLNLTEKAAEDLAEGTPTVEEMTENLRSQIREMEQYQQNIETIKEHIGKEIAPEFAEYLISLGEDGASTIQHIVDTLGGAVEDSSKTGSEVVKEFSDAYIEGLNMQDEISAELAKDSVALQAGLKQLGSDAADWTDLSNLVHDKITALGQQASDALGASFLHSVRIARTIGVSIPEGLAEGIEESDDPQGAIENAIDQINAAIEGQGEGLLKIAEQAGIKGIDGIRKGIENGGDDAVKAYEELIQKLTETNTNIEQSAQETGKQFAEAQSSGIESSADQVVQAAGDAASEAADSAEEKKSEFKSAGEEQGSQFASGIESKRGDAVSAAASVAEGALSAARTYENSWYSVGVNMGEGLRQGIMSKAQEVASQAAQMVTNAIQAAKAAGGIASPSKKFRDLIGKQIGAGTAFGIKISTKKTEEAVEFQMGRTLARAMKWVSKNKDQIKNLGVSISDASEYAWEKLGSTLTARNFGVSKYTYTTKTTGSGNNKKQTTTKKKKSTNTYFGDILDAAQDYIEKMKSIYDVNETQELAYWEKVRKRLKRGTDAWYSASAKIKELKTSIDEAKYDAVVSNAEEYVEKQKAANQMSVTAEIKYWNQIIGQLNKGSEQYKKASDKIADLKARFGTMEAANDLLESYQTYFELSEKAEMDYWDAIRKQYTVGTEERIAADAKYLAAKKNYTSRLKDIEDDYAEKIKEKNAEYTTALNDRKQTLMDAFDIFDVFESKSSTGKELLFNIQAQAAGYEEWNSSIADLMNRGILSDEVMDVLTEKGPSEIAAIKALLTLTDEELRQYQTAYDRKEAASLRQAEKDTEDVKKTVEKEVKELRESEKAEIADVNDTIDTGLLTLATNIKAISEDQTKALAAVFMESQGYKMSDAMIDNLGLTDIVKAVRTAQRTGTVQTITPSVTASTHATSTAPTGTGATTNNAHANNAKAARATAKSAKEQIKDVINSAKKTTKKDREENHSELWKHVDKKYGRAITNANIKSIGSILGISTDKKPTAGQKDKILAALKKKGLRSGAKYLGGGYEWIDELLDTQGPEMIVRRSDNAILTRLKAGDSVIPADLTNNLWKWGAINPDSLSVMSGAEMNTRVAGALQTQTVAMQQGQEDVLASLATIIGYLPVIANGLNIDGKKFVSAIGGDMSTQLAAQSRRRR